MAAQYRKCLHMKWIKGRLYNCGHCPACIGRRNSEISTRVLLDMRHSGKISCYQLRLGARFVHLTYNGESLPENASLVKSDFVNYIKRVRERIYRLTGQRIMFVGSGEYGSKHGRPHYHIFFWRLPEFQGLFEILTDCWKKHHEGSRVVVERLRGKPSQAVNYCVGYAGKSCSKWDKNPRESRSEYFVRTGREAPFVQWSYGVGLEWFNAHKEKLENNMTIRIDGNYMAFPRYFRRKLQEVQSFESWKKVFDKQLDDFCRVGMKIKPMDDLFKVYVYSDFVARVAVNKVYGRDRAKYRQSLVKALEFYCAGEEQLLSREYLDEISTCYFLYEIMSDLGLLDVLKVDFRDFCLREILPQWKMKHFWHYHKIYLDRRRECLDLLAAPDWNSDIDEVFVRYAGYYRKLQDDYVRLIRPSIEQAGRNYCAERQLKDINRYQDSEFVEVLDKERDLDASFLRNKRKR